MSKLIFRELSRQYEKIYQLGNSLDHKAEQSIVVSFVILGYLIQTDLVDILKSENCWLIVFMSIALLIILVSTFLSFWAYRVDSIRTGAKVNQLLNYFVNNPKKLTSLILKGIKNSFNHYAPKVRQKAILIKIAHFLLIFGVTLGIIVQLIFRSIQ